MRRALSGRIVAWNIQDGLDDSRGLPIAEKIIEQKPDVIFLSEASKKMSKTSGYALKALRKAVGPLKKVAYDDQDFRNDPHFFVGIARVAYGLPEAIRFGGRYGLQYRLGDLSLVGYHALDRKNFGTRKEHEQQRVLQAQDVLRTITTGSAIVAGDLNAMHASDANARFLRATGWVSDILPVGEPGKPHSQLMRFTSLAQRLSGMALGDSLRAYEAAGFVDADDHHKGTRALAGRFLNVQLDHIFAREVTITDFAVVAANGLSDHDMVTARFSLL